MSTYINRLRNFPRLIVVLFLLFLVPVSPATAKDWAEIITHSDISFIPDTKQYPGWNAAVWKFADNNKLRGFLFCGQVRDRMAPTSSLGTGEWSIDNEQLCIKWLHWDEGQRLCYQIEPLKDNKYRATLDHKILSPDTGLLSGDFTLID